MLAVKASDMIYGLHEQESFSLNGGAAQIISNVLESRSGLVRGVVDPYCGIDQVVVGSASEWLRFAVVAGLV
jgi:hypothetical protein